MNKRLYSIRDLKAQTFTPPTIQDNDAVAIRAFGDLVTKDKESLLGTHPADFALCFVGEFDILTGILTPAVNGFVQLSIGSDYLVQKDVK